MFLVHHLFFSSLALFFFFAFIVVKLLPSFTTRKAHRNLPPSPAKLPIIGNLNQLGLHPQRSLQSLARKHGPIMLLHLGNKPVLVISSAIAAREVMKTHDLAFSSRPKTSIPTRLLYGKDVAFSPYGEYWRQVKSICVLQLLSNKRVQSFRNVREEETALMIKNIIEKETAVLNLSDMFVSLSKSIVCRVALGGKYIHGEEERNFGKLLGAFTELLGSYNVGDYIPWLSWLNRLNGLDARADRVAEEFDQFLEGVIEDHMDRSRRETTKDFVDVLLEIQRDSPASLAVDRDTIKALILDMFAAGTDTTSAALEWTMVELLRHPRIMKKLQSEVREIGRGKQEITEDDLANMHYLKAVIKEALRLHTPVPLLVPRESIQEVNVMGYDIAAGTQVLVNAWAICRDPSSWEDPEEFRPERFLNNAIDFRGHDFEFTPFGAGRRGCPGILFAMNVIELALANLVHSFEFSLPGGASLEDLEMEEMPGITIHKKNPILVTATAYCF